MSSYSLLKMQHTSLQHSDTKDQQALDVETLFTKGAKFPIKSGTEAGSPSWNANRSLLAEAAKDFKHRIHFSRETWIAVDRSIIKTGSAKTAEVFVADMSKMHGRMHDRIFATFAFTHVDDRIGRIAMAAAHYATKGSVPGDPNYWANELYAQKLQKWMRRAGQGHALAFVAGDFNMNDARYDWAFGREWTSLGDQLKQWPNTGHGPIDGFASYNKDRRVIPVSIEAFSDKKAPMYSDHYLTQGVWRIRHRKTS